MPVWEMVMCKVQGCVKTEIFAKGYCSRHYYQMHKYGKILDRINRDTNIIHIKEDYAIIDLYDRIGNKIGETIIDIEDINKVKNIGWHITPEKRNTKYCLNNKGILLHRLLMNAPEDKVVDHINHNGLDNRKAIYVYVLIRKIYVIVKFLKIINLDVKEYIGLKINKSGQFK